MAAHIDLSWLAQLLTKTPTAADNQLTPDLDPGSQGKFLDENFKDVNTPYAAPSSWQRMVWPDQSATIDRLNNQAVSDPITAQRNNLTELGIRAGNVSRRPSYLQTPGMSPDQAAASGQGSLDQSTPDILRNNANAIYAANAGAPLDAAALHNTATQIIQEAKNRTTQAATEGALGTPIKQATATDTGATLGTAYNTGRLGILDSEFGRQKEENLLGQEQAHGERSLLPQRLSLSNLQLGTQIPIAEEAQSELPYTTATMRSGAIRGLAESERMPIPPRYTDMIDPFSGNITLSKDPLGVNPFALQYAGLDDIKNMSSGGGTQTFKDANGNVYKMPSNGLVTGQGVNPLNTVSRPSVGGGSNNVTNSVPHNTEGSMNPTIPPESSSTTVNKPSVSGSPVSYKEGSISSFKKPNGDYDYDAYYANKKISANASDALQNILHKYDKTFTEGGALVPTMNRSDAVDYISNRAKSMTHEDLKQALNLIHKLPE
jgi:hypothetical protein